MVKPLRIDSPVMGEQPLRRRPILLARLPRVGEAVTIESTEPALVVVSEESAVELPPKAEPSTSYFVDPSHAAESPELEQIAKENQVAASLPTTEHKKRGSKSSSSGKSSSSRRSNRRAPQPTGLGAVYFKIHQQLAPFAGAIVAFALVTAAGLMYWMILSPSNGAFEYPTVVTGDVEMSPVEIPPFVPRSSPLPIPENTGMVEIEEEVKPLVASPTEPPVLEPESDEELVDSDALEGQSVVSNGILTELSPVIDTPGLVSITPAEQKKTEASVVETDPIASEEIAAQAKVGEAVVAAKPEVKPEAAAVYPATRFPEGLDFYRVIVAGKGALLAPSTEDAVAKQPHVQNFVPSQR